MQNIDLPSDKSAAANATIPLPPQPPTQQSVAQPPEATPPTASTVPGQIEPDLLAIADTLATKVRECQIASLGWLLQGGARLRDYRDQLHPDDWSQILRSGRLPVSARMAQMLIRIARNNLIRNRKRSHQLPDSVTILNFLAGLPTAVLEQALDSGVIHRNTTLKEAQSFIQERLDGNRQQTTPQPPPKSV